MTVSHQSHFKSSKESRPIHRSFGLFFKVWKIQIPFSQKVNARCPSWGFIRLTLHEQRTMKNHKEPCLNHAWKVVQRSNKHRSVPSNSLHFSHDSSIVWQVLKHRALWVGKFLEFLSLFLNAKCSLKCPLKFLLKYLLKWCLKILTGSVKETIY